MQRHYKEFILCNGNNNFIIHSIINRKCLRSPTSNCSNRDPIAFNLQHSLGSTPRSSSTLPEQWAILLCSRMRIRRWGWRNMLLSSCLRTTTTSTNRYTTAFVYSTRTRRSAGSVPSRRRPTLRPSSEEKPSTCTESIQASRAKPISKYKYKTASFISFLSHRNQFHDLLLFKAIKLKRIAQFLIRGLINE